MARKEVCTNCQSEISEFEQAYLFQGSVVCELCDQSLRPSPVLEVDQPLELSLENEDIAASPSPVYQRPQTKPANKWDLAAAERSRILYLTFFILKIIGYAIVMAGSPIGFLLYLPSEILFYVFFLRTAKMVGCYSTGQLIGFGIGLFIPGISLLIMTIVDTKLYKIIRDEDAEANPNRGPREFCSMALYSLVLLAFPFIGLPLAYFALRRISNSDGRLYGRILAIISLGLNAAWLGLLSFIIIMAILDDPAAANQY